MLPVIDRSSPTLSRVLRKRRLTITGKTSHLIIAEDANGKMHTIRTAERVGGGSGEVSGRDMGADERKEG